jgi:predicted outer membrane repeat protein
MRSVVIQGNTAELSGGGVYAISASSLVLSSGARLNVINNTAEINNGGGVYLQGQGTRLDASASV